MPADPLTTAREVLALVPGGYTPGPWFVDWEGKMPIVREEVTGTGVLTLRTDAVDADAMLAALSPRLVDALRAAVERLEKVEKHAEALVGVTCCLDADTDTCPRPDGDDAECKSCPVAAYRREVPRG